jgi:hypothetical protein
MKTERMRTSTNDTLPAITEAGRTDYIAVCNYTHIVLLQDLDGVSRQQLYESVRYASETVIRYILLLLPRFMAPSNKACSSFCVRVFQF